MTADVRPGGPTTPRAAVRPKLAFSSGTLPRSHDELRELLHARLRVISWLATVAWFGVIALYVSRVDPLFHRDVLGPWCLGLMGLTAVTAAACVVVLHARRHLALFWLRVQELLIFGLSTTSVAWLRQATLNRALDDTLGSASATTFEVSYAVASNNLYWLTILIVYGVFVPNTWQRTVKVVGGMAVVLGVIDVVAWTSHPLLLDERAFPSLVMTSLTLFIGLSTAIFGSFKISTLQQEASAARQQARELGQYHLKQRLGAGGMGEVYLAEHGLLKRPCAVKLIRPERAGDPQTRARFEREVQVTARLRHPNTVEIYDYGWTDDGTFYYVMEYLDGWSLDELVRRYGPLPPSRAVFLTRQLCGALREAHGVGLVHRDIKPGNVLVCRRGGLHDVAKLVDFGLVQTRETQAEWGKITREGHLVGTPEYMAPEQANDPAAVDARSDLYSLGGVLYFMLTGSPPFAGKTPLETLFAHLHQPVRPLRELGGAASPALDAVVQRCLAKEPAERFSDAESLDRALRACEEHAVWTEEQAAAWWDEVRPTAPGPEHEHPPRSDPGGEETRGD